MADICVITGGSSGIGKATTEVFAEKGYKVYEFSRSGKDTEFAKHVDCDVTNDESVKNAVKRVIDKEKKIDLLINNAGFGISGAIEETETNAAIKQFDVNFFGMVRVTKEFLPYLRENSGKIICISSVAAALAIPFQGYYSASKSAINAYVKALAAELMPYKVKVSALMPGDIKTAFTEKREKGESLWVYSERVKKGVESMEKDEKNGMSPKFIALNLLKIAKKKNPKPIYTAGFKYKLFVALSKILPEKLILAILYSMYAK